MLYGTKIYFEGDWSEIVNYATTIQGWSALVNSPILQYPGKKEKSH